MKTESELIYLVQSGDSIAFGEIAERYEPLMRSLVSKYLTNQLFSQCDSDDLYQEAVIALYNATMSFDADQSEVTFGLYAKVCVQNSLNSVCRRRARQLEADSAQVSVDSVSFDDSGEDARLLLMRIEGLLSPLEVKVFRLFIHGHSHKFIADMLGKPEKSIDNAVYRIRKKLTSMLL